jgi:hypothetical protein
MFVVRQARPCLTRSASRHGHEVLKACATSISTAAATHRLGTTNLTAANHQDSCKLLASKRMMHTLNESYDHILAEKRFPESSAKGGGVGLITLHRPKALNALCDALFDNLIHAVMAFEHDEDVGCVVITGSPKAFAAGELKNKCLCIIYVLCT